jgi:hypothetical protein
MKWRFESIFLGLMDLYLISAAVRNMSGCTRQIDSYM